MDTTQTGVTNDVFTTDTTTTAPVETMQVDQVSQETRTEEAPVEPQDERDYKTEYENIQRALAQERAEAKKLKETLKSYSQSEKSQQPIQQAQATNAQPTPYQSLYGDDPFFSGLEEPDFQEPEFDESGNMIKEGFKSYKEMYAAFFKQTIKDLQRVDQNVSVQREEQERLQAEALAEQERQEVAELERIKTDLKDPKHVQGFVEFAKKEITKAKEAGKTPMTFAQLEGVYREFVMPKVSNQENKTNASRVAVPNSGIGEMNSGTGSTRQIVADALGIRTN